jgi:tetratricopeptide (TPR) repeat protein
MVLVASGTLWFLKGGSRPWRPAGPLAATPELALAELRGPRTFFGGNGRLWMQRDKAALIPEAARDAGSDFSRSMAQAVQEPALFRELDREVRFAEVWLLGDPSGYRPLLEHLLDARDFTLAYVDHTSLIFRRDGAAWSRAALDQLGERFPDTKERAYALALAASKLALVRQMDAALALLEDAEASDPTVPEVWSGWSTYRMVKGEWDKALAAAEKALAIDPKFIPGIACRAQCLYAMKRFTAAWQDAERLVAAHPEDPAMLFYHAKLAHEARAFDSEIDSLRKLIALGEKNRANVSGYRVYLAQAYAAIHDADNAMDQVTLALLDRKLPREQREFADELLGQIQRAIEADTEVAPPEK